MSAKNNFKGVKFMIASASLVTAIGLWNHFASQASLTEQALQKMEPDPQISNVQKLDFAPLPTIIPGYSSNQVSVTHPQQDNYYDPMDETDLREVQRPEAEILPTPQVTVNQIIIGQPGGNPSSNPPVNNTGSSK